MNEKSSELTKAEITKTVDVNGIGLCCALLLLYIAIGIANSPDRFNSKKTLCMAESLTLYTNVGTQVLDKNSKPIPCTPPSNTSSDLF